MENKMKMIIKKLSVFFFYVRFIGKMTEKKPPMYICTVPFWTFRDCERMQFSLIIWIFPFSFWLLLLNRPEQCIEYDRRTVKSPSTCSLLLFVFQYQFDYLWDRFDRNEDVQWCDGCSFGAIFYYINWWALVLL